MSTWSQISKTSSSILIYKGGREPKKEGRKWRKNNFNRKWSKIICSSFQNREYSSWIFSTVCYRWMCMLNVCQPHYVPVLAVVSETVRTVEGEEEVKNFYTFFFLREAYFFPRFYYSWITLDESACLSFIFTVTAKNQRTYRNITQRTCINNVDRLSLTRINTHNFNVIIVSSHST